MQKENISINCPSLENFTNVCINLLCILLGLNSEKEELKKKKNMGLYMQFVKKLFY